MKNPIEYFFNLGNKFTNGDPKRKMDWDYYMLWIMFLAFLTVLSDNLYLFIKTQRFYNLGWSFVMLAILWFQYFGLKSAYEMRKLINSNIENKIESKEEMEKEFKIKKDMKGGKRDNEKIT